MPFQVAQSRLEFARRTVDLAMIAVRTVTALPSESEALAIAIAGAEQAMSDYDVMTKRFTHYDEAWFGSPDDAMQVQGWLELVMYSVQDSWVKARHIMHHAAVSPLRHRPEGRLSTLVPHRIGWMWHVCGHSTGVQSVGDLPQLRLQHRARTAQLGGHSQPSCLSGLLGCVLMLLQHGYTRCTAPE
jgi:hypothetical protein